MGMSERGSKLVMEPPDAPKSKNTRPEAIEKKIVIIDGQEVEVTVYEERPAKNADSWSKKGR